MAQHISILLMVRRSLSTRSLLMSIIWWLSNQGTYKESSTWMTFFPAVVSCKLPHSITIVLSSPSCSSKGSVLFKLSSRAWPLQASTICDSCWYYTKSRKPCWFERDHRNCPIDYLVFFEKDKSFTCKQLCSSRIGCKVGCSLRAITRSINRRRIIRNRREFEVGIRLIHQNIEPALWDDGLSISQAARQLEAYTNVWHE